MAAKVNVIIAHKDDPHLAETIRLLRAQNTTFPFTITVVDDQSRENPESVVPVGVNLLHTDRRMGCGGARNLGVDQTKAPIIAFMDSDLEPGPFWLQSGVDHLRSNLLLTGPVPKRHRSKRPSLAERYNAIESPHSDAQRTYGTGNVMLFRDDFLEAGAFNEKIHRGHDMDFFSRWEGDIEVIPGMIASHPSKNHKEKLKTIEELVRDWKKLGHRPSFLRRLAPDRNLLKNVMGSPVDPLEKTRLLGYHFYLKLAYGYYWVRC